MRGYGAGGVRQRITGRGSEWNNTRNMEGAAGQVGSPREETGKPERPQKQSLTLADGSHRSWGESCRPVAGRFSRVKLLAHQPNPKWMRLTTIMLLGLILQGSLHFFYESLETPRGSSSVAASPGRFITLKSGHQPVRSTFRSTKEVCVSVKSYLLL